MPSPQRDSGVSGDLLPALFGNVRDHSNALGRSRGNNNVDEHTDHKRTQDHVEYEDRHWMILYVHLHPQRSTMIYRREYILCIDLSRFPRKTIDTSPEDTACETAQVRILDCKPETARRCGET